MQNLFPVLFLLGIVLLFWLTLVRPQRRRQAELAHMQSSLEVGDEVILTSGVFGTIRVLDEDTARIEIADGVTIKVALGAIGRQAPEDEPAHVDTAGSDVGEGSEEN